MAIRVGVRGARLKSGSPTSRASIASSVARGRGRGHGTKLLSIDPGLNGTGCVLWLNGQPIAARVFHPLASQIKLDLSESDELVKRARNLANEIRFWAQRVIQYPLPRLTVVIEFPEHHESLKGRTARVTGSIDRLTFLIGVMAGVWTSWAQWDIRMPRVRDWKGQLPKDVVTKRMIKRYGVPLVVKLNVRSHAWDALGIGEWAWRQPWMR